MPKNDKPLDVRVFKFCLAVDKFYQEIQIVAANEQSRITTAAALLKKHNILRDR